MVQNHLKHDLYSLCMVYLFLTCERIPWSHFLLKQGIIDSMEKHLELMIKKERVKPMREILQLLTQDDSNLDTVYLIKKKLEDLRIIWFLDTQFTARLLTESFKEVDVTTGVTTTTKYEPNVEYSTNYIIVALISALNLFFISNKSENKYFVGCIHEYKETPLVLQIPLWMIIDKYEVNNVNFLKLKPTSILIYIGKKLGIKNINKEKVVCPSYVTSPSEIIGGVCKWKTILNVFMYLANNSNYLTKLKYNGDIAKKIKELQNKLKQSGYNPKIDYAKLM